MASETKEKFMSEVQLDVLGALRDLGGKASVEAIAEKLLMTQEKVHDALKTASGVKHLSHGYWRLTKPRESGRVLVRAVRRGREKAPQAHPLVLRYVASRGRKQLLMTDSQGGLWVALPAKITVEGGD